MGISVDFGGRRIRWLRGLRGLRSIIGCGFSFVIFVLIFVFIFGFMALMRSSDVVQGAIEQVEASETAAMMLGEPVKAGWFISGSISTSGSSGEAYLNIPVSGHRGRGTLYVSAYKDTEGWHYTTLSLELKSDGRSINLLQE